MSEEEKPPQDTIEDVLAYLQSGDFDSIALFATKNVEDAPDSPDLKIMTVNIVDDARVGAFGIAFDLFAERFLRPYIERIRAEARQKGIDAANERLEERRSRQKRKRRKYVQL